MRRGSFKAKKTNINIGVYQRLKSVNYCKYLQNDNFIFSFKKKNHIYTKQNYIIIQYYEIYKEKIWS